MQEKIKQRSIKFMFKCKRRSSSGTSSSCSNAREDQAGEHQVHVEMQEKIKQRSIKFMLKSKRGSSSGARHMCSIIPAPPSQNPPHSTPDQAGEHQVHVEIQEKIKQRNIKFMLKCKRRSSSGARDMCSIIPTPPPNPPHPTIHQIKH